MSLQTIAYGNMVSFMLLGQYVDLSGCFTILNITQLPDILGQQHIVLVLHGTEMSIYLNGVLLVKTVACYGSPELVMGYESMLVAPPPSPNKYDSMDVFLTELNAEQVTWLFTQGPDPRISCSALTTLPLTVVIVLVVLGIVGGGILITAIVMAVVYGISKIGKRKDVYATVDDDGIELLDE